MSNPYLGVSEEKQARHRALKNQIDSWYLGLVVPFILVHILGVSGPWNVPLWHLVLTCSSLLMLVLFNRLGHKAKPHLRPSRWLVLGVSGFWAANAVLNVFLIFRTWQFTHGWY